MSSSRRNFVRSSAAAAIVYKLVGRPPAMPAAGPNDEIRLGLIGMGIRGSYHLKTLKPLAGVRLVAVADVYDGHLEWAKEATGGALATTRDYRAVLDRKDIDAVIIATPDHWHLPMVLDALSAGKHVFIEKPLTYSIEEGPRIIEAARRSGKLLMVGSQHATTPISMKARQIVRSGALGTINMVRMSNQRNTPGGAWVYAIPPDASPRTIDWDRFLGRAPRRPFDARHFFRWRCWWEYSGGVSSDLWVHMFTRLHTVLECGAPKSAVAQGAILRWKDGREVPDVMSGLYEYDGFVVDVCANLGNANEVCNGTVIQGSEGTLVMPTRTADDTLVLYPEAPAPEFNTSGMDSFPKAVRERYLASIGLGARRPDRPKAKSTQTIPVERGPEHNEHFIRCLRSGAPSPEDAAFGHCAAGAAHLGNVALRSGRRARWDYATNRVTEV
jgi:predicted dehydrogenase